MGAIDHSDWSHRGSRSEDELRDFGQRRPVRRRVTGPLGVKFGWEIAATELTRRFPVKKIDGIKGDIQLKTPSNSEFTTLSTNSSLRRD